MSVGGRTQRQFLEVLDREEAEARWRAVVGHAPLGTESIPLEVGLGRVLAVTQNDHVNSLAALHFTEDFGRVNAWQLTAVGDSDDPDVRPHHLRGRALWNPELSPDRIVELFEDGWSFKKTQLTEEFGLTEFEAEYGGLAHPLFVVTKAGKLGVVAAGQQPGVQAGDSLISLAPPTEAGAA